MTPRQGKLGAVAGELVEKPALPALAAPSLPSSVADIEGWDVADLQRWIREVAPELARAEVWTDEARKWVGFALWKLRDRLSERDYGTTEDELAEAIRVSKSTLWRWRQAAETAFSLPAPEGAKRRSAGQKARRGDSHSAKKPEVIAAATTSKKSGGSGAAPVSPARAKPDPPPAAPAPVEESESSTADSGSPQEDGDAEYADSFVHANFDAFFGANPDRVAAMDDYTEGRRKATMARRWVDRYEIAVAGGSATGFGAAKAKAEGGCRHSKKTGLSGGMMRCDECGAIKTGNTWRKKAS